MAHPSSGWGHGFQVPYLQTVILLSTETARLADTKVFNARVTS